MEIVDLSSYSGQGDDLIQGKIDVAAIKPTASSIVEADSKESVRWLEMDEDEEEGWDRVQEVAPWLNPEPTDKAAGVDEGVVLPAYGYMVGGYANQDPDEIYSLLKAMDENFDEYKDAASDLEQYSKDEVETGPVSVPFSEGTVEFLKENDMWDDEKEEKNDELIERQEKLKKAWEKVVNEAEEKEIDEEKFPEYWSERKEELVEN